MHVPETTKTPNRFERQCQMQLHLQGSAQLARKQIDRIVSQNRDTEVGAGGNDTYVLQPGYAPITIVNGVSSNAAATGDLQIEGVNPDNI